MKYSMFNQAIAAGVAAGVLAIAGNAAAHAHLVGSDPTAGAVTAPTKTVTLTFNEALEPRFSAATLTTAAGKPLAVTSTTAAKQISVAAQVALAPGGYRLSWHVVSRDGHRTQGGFSFTIR